MLRHMGCTIKKPMSDGKIWCFSDILYLLRVKISVHLNKRDRLYNSIVLFYSNNKKQICPDVFFLSSSNIGCINGLSSNSGSINYTAATEAVLSERSCVFRVISYSDIPAIIKTGALSGLPALILQFSLHGSYSILYGSWILQPKQNVSVLS